MSKHVPRSCRVMAVGARGCICFQRGNARHKAPNHLFNICNLSRLGGHCLSKRLDAIFNPSRVLFDFVDFLLHRTGAKSCPFKVRTRTVGRTQFEEEAGAGDTGTSVPSLTRAMREARKLQLGYRHLDKTKPERLVNGKNTAHVRTGNGLSQHGHGWNSSVLAFAAIER